MKRKIKRNRRTERILEYKWELLRRNPTYQRDFRNRAKFSQDYWRPKNFWDRKYGVNFPYDPSVPFNRLKKRRDFMAEAFKGMLLPVPAVVIKGYSSRGLSYVDAADHDNLESHSLPHYVKALDLRVSLLHGKGAVIRAVDALMRQWTKESGGGKKERFRYAKYDEYLKIYDLCTKKKMIRSDIAIKLYPSTDLDAAMRHVDRSLREARKLVKGGYRHLR